jgi:hypothetical protein
MTVPLFYVESRMFQFARFGDFIERLAIQKFEPRKEWEIPCRREVRKERDATKGPAIPTSLTPPPHTQTPSPQASSPPPSPRGMITRAPSWRVAMSDAGAPTDKASSGSEAQWILRALWLCQVRGEGGNVWPSARVAACM